MFAPIALFVYKRPEHTLRLLESLASNPQAADSELWIFCEGPKGEGDRHAVDEVRRLVKSGTWAGPTRIIEQEKNLGCANSVIAGINMVLEKHDRIIVLEDDLVLSPHFLAFMNEALIRYRDVDRVMQVCGYMFEVDLPDEKDVLVLPFISSWGWATWRRAWRMFDSDLRHQPWLDRWSWRRFRFDLYGAYGFNDMLEQYRRGEIDAWDIRWYLSVFRKHGLAVFPRKSLVMNEGFEGGTHPGDPRLKVSIAGAVAIERWPASIKVDHSAFYLLREYLANSTSRTQ